MKRRLCVTFLFIILSLLFPFSVYADDITINTDKISQGLVQVQYTGDLSKPIKIMVQANGEQDVFTVRDKSASYVPLQMGQGTYTVSVLQQIEGTKYKPLKSESMYVGDVGNNTAVYTSPSLIVNYNAEMEAIKGYGDMTANKGADDQIMAVYQDLVTKYGYDYDKAKNLPSDYVPVIDDMYRSKLGICYDYSVLFASLLRYNGIPTKLIMGYAPDINSYHAWNEVYMDGKWITVDTTYDSQFQKAKMSYTFAKDASKRKVVKVY